MKKILYLSIFFFSFILLGISSVKASDLNLANLGYTSCLNDDQVVYTCGLSSTTGQVEYFDGNSYVSQYFIVSDGGLLSLISSNPNSSLQRRICFYDSNYSFISCYSVVINTTPSEINLPSGAFFARLALTKSNNIIYSYDDDFNSISSLGSAINSLTETVGNVFIDFTWVFLLAFSIVVIGFIIALILRVGK